MRQQINFYQAEFRPQKKIFCATTLLKSAAAIVFAMVLAYVYALQALSGADRELQLVSAHEAAAVERLEKLHPVLEAIGGEQTWLEKLDAATRLIEEKQLVLSLVQGSTLGDTQGFSRYLMSLARQHTDGLWLTYISLSASGDNTRLEGRALRAEMVPVYLQGLAEEAPFSRQRFNQFQIEGAVAAPGGSVSFSMNSDVKLMAQVDDKR